jgi:hypothetical protein
VTYAEYVNLMFDLQVLALQADLTRVVTMMMGREGSMRTYPRSACPTRITRSRTTGNTRSGSRRSRKVNTLHMTLFAVRRKLQATPDGDGTLLDHSLIVYGSGIADGDKHTHEDLPCSCSEGSGFKMGRHLQYPSDTPMTNLYLTGLDKVGVRPETIGDSTGQIEHLTDVSA